MIKHTIITMIEIIHKITHTITREYNPYTYNNTSYNIQSRRGITITEIPEDKEKVKNNTARPKEAAVKSAKKEENHTRRVSMMKFNIRKLKDEEQPKRERIIIMGWKNNRRRVENDEEQREEERQAERVGERPKVTEEKEEERRMSKVEERPIIDKKEKEERQTATEERKANKRKQEEEEKPKAANKLNTIKKEEEEAIEKPCKIIKILPGNKDVNNESLSFRRKIEDELTPLVGVKCGNICKSDN